MESIQVLFSFSFSSDDGLISSPLRVEVSHPTQKFFSEHNINFIKQNDKYTVVWLVKNKKDLKKCALMIFTDLVCGFNVFFEDPNIFETFDIEVGKVYYLKNGEGKFLHKGDCVSINDSIEEKEYCHHLLFRVLIDMNKILKKTSENNFEIRLKKKKR